MKRAATLTHVEHDSEALRRPLELRLFRRMFSYAKNYRPILRWLIVLVVVRSVQISLMAWTLSAVINGPISHGDYTQLVWGVAGYTLLGLFTNYTLYHRMHTGLLLGEGVVHDLRNDIFSHLQKMTMQFYNKTKIGRIISRVTSDAESVRAGLQEAVFVSVVAVGQMLVALAILIYTDWGLSLVVIASAPLYYVVYVYFRRRLSDAHRAVQESFSRVTATLAESVTGIRVTQGFARQEINARMFSDLVADHAEYNIAVTRTAGTFNPVLELMGQMLIGAIFIVGGYFVLERGADVAMLVTFYFLANEVLTPIASLGHNYNVAVTAMAGAERVFSVLDRQPDFRDEPDAIDLPRMQGRVEFRDLSFGYDPAKLVLRDINFIAKPGKTIALVGHTGSGKTSIINLISKFYLPTTGQLLIDGHDIRKITARSLHHQMGIVLQQNFLFTGTVMENIRVGNPQATDEQVIAAARELDCLDVIEKLPNGFQTEVGERGSSLSLGQRQLICFTRAMLANPAIMILDEATSSIDTMTEARIQNALKRLLTGRTSFVVAHRLSTIRHADLVLVLDHGRIIERGSHVELLATGGVYANLYQQFIRTSEA